MNRFYGVCCLGFTVLILIGYGCNKPSNIGSDIFEDDSLDVLKTDDFEIKVKTYLRSPDVIFSDEESFINTQLLGELNDSEFGYVRSEVFTQMDLPPRFAGNPLDSAIIDSAQIQLRYDTFGLFGTLMDEVTLEVYELEEDIDPFATYRSTKTFDIASMPYVTHTFTPNPYDSIKTFPGPDDTLFVSPRLIIPLEVDTFPGGYLERLRNLDSIYWAEPDSFRTLFKGFNFKFAEGQNYNTILGFKFETEASSSMCVWYRIKGDTVQRKLAFTFGRGAAKVSYFDHDYTGTLVGQILADSLSTPSDSITFIQEMQGLSPILDIKGLSKLQGSLINSAELTLTIKEEEDPDLIEPTPSIITTQEWGDSTLVDIIDTEAAKFQAGRDNSIVGFLVAAGGSRTECADTTQSKYIYSTLITSHLQDVVNSGQDSTRIYISSFFQPESPRRAIFFGSESKYPVKLVVRYTKVL